MDIVKAQMTAEQLMTEHGLYAQGWRFEYDSSKTRFGRCSLTDHVISLSRPLVSLNTEADVLDTILHEIAHALVGSGHGHDLVWQSKARAIGARPVRCYDSEKTAMPAPKYIGTCALCHAEFPAYKFGKAMARGKQYHNACGKRGTVVWREA